uniref:50S ribosomal protein L12, chloroplastic n=1 Tax=Neogoniolithon spectabile TaxID=231755 RepID=A0A3G3MGN6_9FLOR|nr:ribosomal protein L12 [Neogoniolithon spectabile]AYR05990.1 ribosomal protein L12 [Neogoniolithon spectabile]
MSEKINSLIDELKSLTLLEAAELVREIENVFGVNASVTSAPSVVVTSSDDANGADATKQEKVEFDVVLEEVPASKKIAILKVVRSLTGLGLKDAKNLVESAPRVLKESVTREEAESVEGKLQEAGAVVSLK